VSAVVTGVRELDMLFNNLSKGMANRIARPGLAKAGRLTAKKVKAAIPSRFKGARSGIKSKSIKTKRNAGFAAAKVGFNVGQKKTKREDQKPQGKRKGVGVGTANAFWFAAGTDRRWTGTKRAGGHRKGRKNRRVLTGGVVRYTGRMLAQFPGVSDIARQSKQEIDALLRREIQIGIEKEVIRQAKKRK